MVAGWARAGSGSGWVGRWACLSDQLEAERKRTGTRATRRHGGATAGGRADSVTQQSTHGGGLGFVVFADTPAPPGCGAGAEDGD